MILCFPTLFFLVVFIVAQSSFSQLSLHRERAKYRLTQGGAAAATRRSSYFDQAEQIVLASDHYTFDHSVDWEFSLYRYQYRNPKTGMRYMDRRLQQEELRDTKHRRLVVLNSSYNADWEHDLAILRQILANKSTEALQIARHATSVCDFAPIVLCNISCVHCPLPHDWVGNMYIVNECNDPSGLYPVKKEPMSPLWWQLRRVAMLSLCPLGGEIPEGLAHASPLLRSLTFVGRPDLAGVDDAGNEFPGFPLSVASDFWQLRTLQEFIVLQWFGTRWSLPATESEMQDWCANMSTLQIVYAYGLVGSVELFSKCATLLEFVLVAVGLAGNPLVAAVPHMMGPDGCGMHLLTVGGSGGFAGSFPQADSDWEAWCSKPRCGGQFTIDVHMGLEGPVPKGLDHCGSQLTAFLIHNIAPHPGFQGPISHLDMSTWSALSPSRSLSLQGHSLNGSLPCLPGQLESVDFLQGNAFTGGVPLCWDALTRLKKIDLSHNLLSGPPLPWGWSSLDVSRAYIVTDVMSPGVHITPPDFYMLSEIDFSDNPLNISFPFLKATACQFSSLRAITCQNCGLYGDWDVYESLGSVRIPEGTLTMEILRCPALEAIDLRNNRLTTLAAPEGKCLHPEWVNLGFPPQNDQFRKPTLRNLNLAGNPLQLLHPFFFNAEFLDLRHTDMRGPVFTEEKECPIEEMPALCSLLDTLHDQPGAPAIVEIPLRVETCLFASQVHAPSGMPNEECAIQTQAKRIEGDWSALVKVDSSFNRSALCRCMLGFVPSGSVSEPCQPCPADFYAGLRDLQCTACPNHSSTRGQVNSSSIRDCQCKPGYVMLNDECFPCPGGTWSPLHGMRLLSSCLDCPSGRFTLRNGSGSIDDCLCGPGYGLSNSSILCESCSRGRFKRTIGTYACRECKVGKYATRTGMKECKNCSRGSASMSEGSPKCKTCMVGRYADEEGMSFCKHCAAAPDNASWTTMLWLPEKEEWTYYLGATSNESCGCDRGFYSHEGECIQCTEGMVCEGMGELLIAAGYYSAWPISLYHCFGDELKCPGGPPNRTCASGRAGISCATCETSKRAQADGTCIDCLDMDYTPITVACAALFVFLCVVYFVLATQRRVGQSHIAMLSMITCNHLLTFAQQLGVIDMFYIDFGEPIEPMLETLRVFTFEVEIFNLSCIAGLTNLTRYVARVSFIFVCWIIVTVTHVISVLLFYKANFKSRMASYISCIGTICLILYISIVSTVLGPLQCSRHPNGKTTVRDYKDVICWDSNIHTVMVVIGLSCLSIPILFYVYIVYVSWKLPREVRQGNAEFLEMHGFLFFRFRPGACWYIHVVVVRSLIIATMPIVPHPIAQIVMSSICHTVCLILILHVKPWRVQLANTVDTACCSIILSICNLAAFFVKEENLDYLSWSVIGIVVFTVINLALLSARFIWRALICEKCCKQKPFKFFLCHHKARAGSFARLLKTALRKNKQFSGDVFLDSDNLSQLDNLFSIVAHEVEHLVILGTKDVFLRPWCAGEMTIARLGGVKVTIVAMPDWRPPDDVTIEHFEDLVDMAPLTENSLSLDMVQATMRWIRTLPVIRFPAQMCFGTLDALVSLMVTGAQSGEVCYLSQHMMTHMVTAINLKRSVLILVDDRDMEATAAAHILATMMNKFTMHSPSDVPAVHLASEDLPCNYTHECLIVFCTKDCFERSCFLERLAEACEQEARILPVTVDVNFSFPSPEFLTNMRSNPSPVEGKTGDQLADMISSIFHEIAPTFQPQSASATLLLMNAEKIAHRVMSRGVARVRLSSDGSSNPSKPSLQLQESDNPSKQSLPSLTESDTFEVGAGGAAGDEDDCLETGQSAIQQNRSVDELFCHGPMSL